MFFKVNVKLQKNLSISLRVKYIDFNIVLTLIYIKQKFYCNHKKTLILIKNNTNTIKSCIK